MRVYQYWQGFKDSYNKMVIGLGNFDGVHIGHQKLIIEMVSLARKVGGTSAVFTFYPHPLTVLSPGNCPPFLLTQESKFGMIAEMGVDLLLLIPFSLEFSELSPHEFVRVVLHEGLGAYAVVVGYNYTFGHRGKGDASLLVELGQKYNIHTHIVPPMRVNDTVVSSTLIRNLLLKGDVTEAAKHLGYYPFVEGKVVTGDQRGRSIGFPTANLEVDRGILIPSDGVFLAVINVDGSEYCGVANIGSRPTFNGRERSIEAHIFDFSQDIYGKIIKVSFYKRLREEIKFGTVSDLIKQIKKDVILAKGMVKNIENI